MSNGAKDKQIEIAKKMLDSKLDLGLISQLTGLKKQEIEKLK